VKKAAGWKWLPRGWRGRQKEMGAPTRIRTSGKECRGCARRQRPARPVMTRREGSALAVQPLLAGRKLTPVAEKEKASLASDRTSRPRWGAGETWARSGKLTSGRSRGPGKVLLGREKAHSRNVPRLRVRNKCGRKRHSHQGGRRPIWTAQRGLGTRNPLTVGPPECTAFLFREE